MKKLSVILAALLLILSLAACGQKSSADPTESGAAADETTAAKEIRVPTPYADLILPADYDGAVTYGVESEDPYMLTFWAGEDEVELFSFVFNGDGKGLTLIGTLIGENENTVIYARVCDLDSGSKDYLRFAAYQEEMSDIIGRLKTDYEFVTNAVIEPDQPEDRETFDIKTKVVTLKYPTEFKDKVNAAVSDDGVRFSAGGTALFDILFGEGADGHLIGTYNGTPISIALHDLDKDQLTEEAYQELSAMQDASNVILDYLEADANFVYR
jgi:hypothetical protein